MRRPGAARGTLTIEATHVVVRKVLTLSLPTAGRQSAESRWRSPPVLPARRPASDFCAEDERIGCSKWTTHAHHRQTRATGPLHTWTRCGSPALGSAVSADPLIRVSSGLLCLGGDWTRSEGHTVSTSRGLPARRTLSIGPPPGCPRIEPAASTAAVLSSRWR